MYLSVSGRNASGENSNFSSQLRSQIQCVSPIIYPFVCIQYHVIVGTVVKQVYYYYSKAKLSLKLSSGNVVGEVWV